MSLVVRTPNWLGDLVMSLPAISSLLVEYPRMSLWSNSRVSGLIPVFFPSMKVLTGGRIKRNDFKKLLLMTDSFRSAMQGFISGIPDRIGYGTDFRSFLLTKALRPPADRYHHHSIDYNNLAIAAGASGVADVPGPSVKAEGSSHIAYFAGARYGNTKRWPGFQELAWKMYKSTGFPSVFYGSGEEDLALSKAYADIPLSEIRTDLTLPELASNLLSSVLAVGNDSGGVHVSAALGIPTVTLFGSTSPVWTAPAGSFTRTIKSDRVCSPCFKSKCPYGNPECLNDISIKTVHAACLEIMERARVTNG